MKNFKKEDINFLSNSLKSIPICIKNFNYVNNETERAFN